MPSGPSSGRCGGGAWARPAACVLLLHSVAGLHAGSSFARVSPRAASPCMSGLGDFLGQVAKNLKQMSDQRVGRASHIMLRPSADATNILSRWKADIADDEGKFQARARESSQCRSAPRGGDLGFVTRGKLSSEFDDVIFEEEVGFVYGPIQTQFGYHLIYLHSCREPTGAAGGMSQGRRA